MRAAATCQTEGNGQELRREWVASGLIRRDQVAGQQSARWRFCSGLLLKRERIKGLQRCVRDVSECYSARGYRLPACKHCSSAFELQ